MGSRDIFVVQPGRLRVVSVGLALVFCAALFLLIAVGVILLAATIDLAATWVGLTALALCLTALAVFLLLYLHTLAVRVEVGTAGVKVRLPRMRGHLPLPGLIRADIPYDAVASVQGRAELYGKLGRLWVQRSYSLVTRDGERLPLGYVVEGEAFQHPFEQAAAMIAERAPCPFVNRGPVHAGGIWHAMIHGAPDWSVSQ